MTHLPSSIHLFATLLPFFLLLLSTSSPSLSAFIDVDWSIDSTLQSLLDEAVQPGIASLVITTLPYPSSTLTTPLSSSFPSPATSPSLSCPFTPLTLGSSGWRRTDTPIHSRAPLLPSDTFALGHTQQLLTLLAGQQVELSSVDYFNFTIPQLFPYLRLSDTGAALNSSATGFFALSPYAANLSVDWTWRNVTLGQLLLMTSGLTLDPTTGPCPWSHLLTIESQGREEPGTGYPLPSRRVLFACVLSSRIAAYPRDWRGSAAGWQWSAEGLVVAAMVVEEMGSRVWEELVQERLLTPLNVTSATWDSPPTPNMSQRADRPVGHAYVDATDVYSSDASLQRTFPQALRPAAAVHVSLYDWARYVACWLPSLRVPWVQTFPDNPNPFKRPASWRTVFGRPQVEATPWFGAGAHWNLFGTLEVSAASYDPTGSRATSYMAIGNVGTFCSAVFVFPADQLAILSASNACEVYRNVSDWMLVKSGQVLYAEFVNRTRQWKEVNDPAFSLGGLGVWDNAAWAIVAGSGLILLLIGAALGYWMSSSAYCMGQWQRPDSSSQALLMQ